LRRASASPRSSSSIGDAGICAAAGAGQYEQPLMSFDEYLERAMFHAIRI
jgi:hypothetical protein